ncbi:hypothetical protein D3C87_1285430 [compost metagenome]
MSDAYWSDLRRLSTAAAESGKALDDFLARVPAPRSPDELADYDQVRDRADAAFRAWSQYCEAKK